MISVCTEKYPVVEKKRKFKPLRELSRQGGLAYCVRTQYAARHAKALQAQANLALQEQDETLDRLVQFALRVDKSSPLAKALTSDELQKSSDNQENKGGYCAPPWMVCL
jgi:hypothetical protein